VDANFIGIDVGTGSARAGVFNAAGKLLGAAKRGIALFRQAGDIAEQSSQDIWQAVCASVRDAIGKAGVDPQSVTGIGFDATCSLVVLGESGAPLPVGNSGDDSRDIIVWMDHRAITEAERINAGGHAVLDYVGGTISPEMETPKLLWLKQNQRQTFDAAWQFFDLADYLTWRATGSLARSICTLSCKWTYLSHERRWDADFFRSIGLEELADDDFTRIGTEIVEPGTALGNGLSAEAASALGLRPGIAVAAGLIDAHAGGVGTLGAQGGSGDLRSRMAYVFGTSACTMASTPEPVFVDGVWGPYFSAMVPDLWLLEGGQSAAGAAIDHLVRFHPAAPEAEKQAKNAGMDLVAWLSAQAGRDLDSPSAAVGLAGQVHVVPEFLGNRAPFADPGARAMIAGLGMERDLANLVGLYVAGICSLGYGVRQIIAALGAKGLAIDTIVVSGGAAQSPLVRQLLADATGVTISAPVSEEPVMLGSAMLGAVAAGYYSDIVTAMAAMSQIGTTYTPSAAFAAWHEKRFTAFSILQAAGRDIRDDPRAGGSERTRPQ
jgi:D-ribulokinase